MASPAAAFGWNCIVPSNKVNRSDLPIILVEDNEDDAFLMMRALKIAGIATPIKILTDGQQAIDYLSACANGNPEAGHALRSLFFLDLKLPYLNGFEVLAWLRERKEFDAISVIILTGSAEARDRDKAMALGAQNYLVKPPTSETLKTVFDSITAA